MGGQHVAAHGDLAQALLNPAGVLLDENGTQFGIEGLLTNGPEFDTRGGLNSLRSEEANPPTLLGFSTTYGDDFSFALFDALRYNAHFTGTLGSLDDPRVAIADYEEETRLNATGLAAAVRVKRTVVGVGLYLDRQKVFKSVDYVANDTIPSLDFEAFGTSNALHGAIGVLWTPRARTTYGFSFSTRVDLRNNITQHTFLVGFVDPDNPNSFFSESSPVSDDAFPWSVAAGARHRLAPDTDLFVDFSYVDWSVESNRRGVVALSVGGEWRASRRTALRAGLYTQPDPGDYGGAPGLTEEDLRLFDLRSATASSYSDENDEIFLTGGVGVLLGAFSLDAAVEDSHFISDYGRTLFKIGLTGRLVNR